MATRPVFVPNYEGDNYVATHYVDFEWFPGLALSQKQKSIASLHAGIKKELHLESVLEISSKSTERFGVDLSAFNLRFTTVRPEIEMSVECAFQGSKVFENGGPYNDLFHKTSLEAKKDQRLTESGRLVGFDFFGIEWDLEPQTVFYDWLYLNALLKNPELCKAVLEFEAFTDIEFNPKRSVNCQAYTIALFKSLSQRGILGDVMKSKKSFLACVNSMIISNAREDQTSQAALF